MPDPGGFSASTGSSFAAEAASSGTSGSGRSVAAPVSSASGRVPLRRERPEEDLYRRRKRCPSTTRRPAERLEGGGLLCEGAHRSVPTSDGYGAEAKACCFTAGHAHSLPRDRALEGVSFCPQPGGLPPVSRDGPVFAWPWARRVRHLAPKAADVGVEGSRRPRRLWRAWGKTIGNG